METGPQEEVKSPQAVPGTSTPFSGTVTIFFSDIRGFTDYTERFGDEAAYRILREHNAIVHKQIEAFGGVVVKTQGDSFMVAFTTARGAILCAVAIQKSIAESDQNQAGPRIAVGVGINTGEPIQEGGDYFGSMVNLTSRICAAAGPGQILIAETTRYVAGRIEAVDYLDRGLHELKGFPEAKRLCEVVWRRPGTGASAAAAAAPAVSEEDTAALTAAVQRGIGVLNRILSVTHLDDPAFGPLIECQAKAGEFRLLLSRTMSERRGVAAKQVEEAVLPFESLLTLVLERDKLTEERWAQLEARVTRTFGRPLVTAAARGRLSGGALEKREPEEAAKQEEGSTVGPRVSVIQTLAPPAPDPRAAGVRWWTGTFSWPTRCAGRTPMSTSCSARSTTRSPGSSPARRRSPATYESCSPCTTRRRSWSGWATTRPTSPSWRSSSHRSRSCPSCRRSRAWRSSAGRNCTPRCVRWWTSANRRRGKSAGETTRSTTSTTASTRTPSR